jgi:hypothetical protein
MSCLQVNISVKPIAIKPKISLFCSIGDFYFPLLVDDGYLFVEENGIKYFLCVDKK